MTALLKNDRSNKYSSFSRLVAAMLWLRFSFVIIVLFVILFLGCFLVFHVVSRRSDQVAAESDRIRRLPMVRLLLT